MTTEPHVPADTQMMGIVHQAMRRDLHRAQTSLADTPPVSQPRLKAIARHLTWMMGFIRAHHAAEDRALYPLVRERDPAAVQLLDEMHAAHEAVASAMTAVEAAAAACGAH